MHRPLLALALLAAAPTAHAGALHGTVIYPPVHEDVDPRPEARRPLGGWRLENGKIRIALEADVRRDVVVVLEPAQPAKLDDPQALPLEARPGGLLEPRIAVARLGVAVTWKNADTAPRIVTIEDGDTLLPPDPAPPGATREVRFSIAGEYLFLDPEHPFSRSLVIVVASPYVARADEHGVFSIDAPDGRYRIKAWWRGQWIDAGPVELGPHQKDVAVRLQGALANPPTANSASPPPAAAEAREKN